MPHNTATAPPSIPEIQTTKDCLRCRSDGAIATVLKFEHDRLQAQEAALRGMQIHLPSVFGALATKSVGLNGVDERIRNLRKDFARFNENAWQEFAQTERRERW